MTGSLGRRRGAALANHRLERTTGAAAQPERYVAGSLLVFAAGVEIGQVAWVRDLLGKSPTPQAPLLEPSVVQQRIDQLTEGYNATVRQVTAQILGHEDAAARTPFSSDRQQHIEGANRLHSLLDDEHKKYRAALSDLRGFQTVK